MGRRSGQEPSSQVTEERLTRLSSHRVFGENVPDNCDLSLRNLLTIFWTDSTSQATYNTAETWLLFFFRVHTTHSLRWDVDNTE